MARIWLAASLLAVLAASPAGAQQSATRTRDHYVTVVSNDPAVAGQKIRIYIRERGTPEVLEHGAGAKVVLFVHGAGTPAEVAFDVGYRDYSWMGYLASAGYDVFAVDMLGYGRSTRPPQMNDKCNLAAKQQQAFGVHCAQSYPGALTNIDSDCRTSRRRWTSSAICAMSTR